MSSAIKQLKQFQNTKILIFTLNSFDFDLITNNNKNPDNFIWKNLKKINFIKFGRSRI